MILASGKAAPLRFLLGVVLCWTIARAAMVTGWRPAALRPALWGPSPGSMLDGWPEGLRAAVAPALPAVGIAAPKDRARGWAPATGPLLASAASRLPAPLPASSSALLPARDGDMPLVLASYMPDDRPLYPAAAGDLRTAPLMTDPHGDGADTPGRLRGSGWLFLRGGGGVTPLSPQGRIGGGQAGARVLYAFDAAGRLAASARISRAIDGPRQTEAAIGLDVRPLANAVVHLTVERRIAIDRGGRNAWAAGVSGGVYGLALAPATRLDGYAQAGVVGLRRRDLYADGAIRAGREVPVGEGSSLTLGGGAWGAAQPGAARLDVGPSAVLRLPVGPTTLAAAVDYRGRVAGDARPGSGPAVTVGVDF